MHLRPTRRGFLRTAGGAALAAALPSPVRCATRTKRDGQPNVLFLMTDEQHHRSLSATGNPYIQTPNMDRLAKEGALFTNATCVTPYCSPSRASIITGLYPHTHGILQNVSPGRNQQPPLRQDAFANTETILHKQGYATGHRGKWHLGDKGNFNCYQSWEYASKTPRDYRRFLDQRLPDAKFKDHPSPGKYLGRPVEMIPAVEKGYHAFHAIPNNRVAYISIIGRSVVPPDLLPETQITNQVLELIHRHASDNFMITASWSPPHDLWVMPEPYYGLVDRGKIKLTGSTDVPTWDQRGPSKRLGDIMGPEGIREYTAIYHAMVRYIDDQLGRVLKKLDELKLADNTLVIFTSDHGDMVGAHGCIGKSIFSFYDDLVRVPLLMRLPGRIKPGTVLNQPVSQIDLMPTILDYVGQAAPIKIHGRSTRPLIEGQQVAWRDYAFCQRAGAGRMLRTERYKFVYRPKPRAVALYDLKEDPNEDHNLADDRAHAATVRAMHKRLCEVMKTDGDPMRERFAVDPLA
ncbi:MAG: sulfatase-like hydrolase/transferase [Phycisphaerae bacterium]|nr:sulfatase-like hydrolase/transferase [Phycisphaerae bacterium]